MPDTPRNPFTPTFGRIPPFMAGRDDVIRDIVRAFDQGIGNPNLSTIFVGARGTGKTALLTYLCEESLAHGWVAASVSALPGMLEDIEERALVAAGEFVETPDAMHLKGINIGQLLGVEWERAPVAPGNWRTRMTNILDMLAEHGVGLLIAVDEVRVDLDEMVQLASVYQHFVREGRKVALLMAGLPSKVAALLQDESVSFLRRANYYQLGRVDDDEIRIALSRTVEAAGRAVADAALDEAVSSISGFPYMMQLVGYHAWEAFPGNEEIALLDVKQAEEYAARDVEKKILETTYRELSKGDLRFLSAMLEDEDEESDLADIARRMGKKSNYASQYKRRLVAQGIVEDRGHGVLAIEVPLFKEYLRKRMR
ncbi:MAG: ATP-binding protein [Eggerthellaceae bacterium]|nr:ATP-binding protein [Eggerthellaceae bacterium]